MCGVTESWEDSGQGLLRTLPQTQASLASQAWVLCPVGMIGVFVVTKSL